jgi:hypothetical protein
MSAFKEHYILSAAPKRAPLAVLSELVRLAFVSVTSGLCAAIFWLLTAGAYQRSGGPGIWFFVFMLCALLASSFVVLALRGMLGAARDRARVDEQARR